MDCITYTEKSKHFLSEPENFRLVRKKIKKKKIALVLKWHSDNDPFLPNKKDYTVQG